MLRIVDSIDFAIGWLCRATIIVTGVFLTLVMTANVIARYVLATGGFGFAQELPTLLFPWFIMAGVTLAALGGAHMAVEWLYGKLEDTGRVRLMAFGNLLVILSFGVLAWQSLVVAAIAGAERSPVLGLPNSIGYYCVAAGAVLVAVVTATATLRILMLDWNARPATNVEEMPL
ncbi:TRAP transporter small permease subunit [Mesorhizobium sp. M1328]|uniref:TRAP transporter small permease n=1 Tax=Mesorhizobium sp. M1328 TaxID=2957082 RepID=UPI0033393135